MQDADYQQFVLPALLALLLVGFVIILITSGNGGNGASQPKGSLRNEASGASNAGSTTVTVRRGDTPTAIADRAGMSVNQLLELNPNLDPRTLRPGQKLKLAR